VPGSKRDGSPSHDARLRQILDQVRPRLPDVRELIVAHRSVASGIKGLTVAERVRLWEIREADGAPEPTTVIVFDDVIAGGSHFKAAALILQARYPDAEIIGLFLARRALGAAGQPGDAVSHGPKRRRATIPTCGRGMDDVTTDAVEALLQNNVPPVLMVRSGDLVRMRELEAVPLNQGKLVAEPVSVPGLRERLTRIARFTTHGPSGQREVYPPVEIVKNILARPAWPFPVLAGIVETPILRPDGTYLGIPGYDKATGLIYNPSAAIKSLVVPERPTVIEIQIAVRALLDDCLGDFPFFGPASRANALAMMLTPIVRHAVGCVPLAVVDAPEPGSGKGLLCSVAGLILTGRSLGKSSLPEGRDELRKTITALLLSGEPIVVFDNLDASLRSAQISAVLTTEIWCDRLLGVSRTVYPPNTVTWIATGNKIRLSKEMRRRCFRIELNAGIERPWLRHDFHHAHLLAWVTKNRANLLFALLTLVRAYVAAPHCEVPIPILGSFERWCTVVGTILGIAGVTGFLSDCVPQPPTRPARAKSAAANG
jgi:hypothetical protein